ncbi:MAG: methylenetetrahydrofolate reductase [Demequinaceae bacterium]|nr:methylenetetrahydrofolate reductase [Demequinaceae bacterium]
MIIRERIAAPSPTLSFEFFPPRTLEGRKALDATIAELATTEPDFVSVTYGASGSTRDSSREVVRGIAQGYAFPPLAHLTCVSASRTELTEIIEEFLAEGVRGFLALRGDPPQGEPDWRPHPDGLIYASQLVAFIREVARVYGLGPDEISIGVAAFPGIHADERWRVQGLEVLQAKQDAGADFAITQVFFDAHQYLDLVVDAQAAGITLPILPGIIPVLDSTKASRLEQMTGVVVPPSLLAELAAAPNDDAARSVGVAHAAALARAVLEAGAPGIHVYTFNQHRAALELVDALDLGRTGRRS